MKLTNYTTSNVKERNLFLHAFLNGEAIQSRKQCSSVALHQSRKRIKRLMKSVESQSSEERRLGVSGANRCL
jgi:hypothetical protein